MRSMIPLALLLLSVSLMGSCTKADPVPVKKTATNETVLPESYWLASIPDGAKAVQVVREASKEGDTAVVVGRIGTINDSRALFQLVDKEREPCNERPEDSCATPWDY